MVTVNKIFVFTLGISWVSTRTVDMQTAQSRENSKVNPFAEILVIFLFVYNQIPGNPVSFFFFFICQSIFKHPLDVTRYLLLVWLTMTSWVVNSVTLRYFLAETSFFTPFFSSLPLWLTGVWEEIKPEEGIINGRGVASDPLTSWKGPVGTSLLRQWGKN